MMARTTWPSNTPWPGSSSSRSRPARNPARPGRQFATLIIGNPTGDLPAADREVDELVRLIEATPGTAPPRILMRRRATRSAVLGELASGAYDLIHFSGHAVLRASPPRLRSARGGAGGEGAPETGGLDPGAGGGAYRRPKSSRTWAVARSFSSTGAKPHAARPALR